MPVLLLIGPAGSGKTTITFQLAAFARGTGRFHGVYTCNLDPGNDAVLGWDLDVRRTITLKDVMRRKNLGPNGAMVESFKEMLGSIDSILEGMDSVASDELLVIDTPGQLEPLIFNPVGNALLSALRGKFPDMVAAFLMPGDIICNSADFAFLVLVQTGLNLKILVPMFQVVSKADLLAPGAERYINSPMELKKQLASEGLGEYTEFSMMAVQAMETMCPGGQVPFVSVKGDHAVGIPELVDMIDEIKCACGDLS